jgi:arginyl-tRNA synthetase
MNSLKDIKKEIARLLKTVDLLKTENIEETLETPPQSEFGDLSSSVCFPLSKKLKKSPMEIADKIVSQIKIKKDSVLSKVESKSGHINFFYNYFILSKIVLNNILKEKEKLGQNKMGKGKKVMIEFSQPNPVHPMHIGHSRSTFLGDSLSNILDSMSYKTVRANYMNNTGLQVAKLVTAYQIWGKNKKPTGKPDLWLWKLYVKFHGEAEKNPNLEEKARDTLRKFEIEQDEKTIRVWNKVVNWCIEGFKETYKKLGVNFDIYFFENEHRKFGKRNVEKAIKTGIAFKSDEGAIVADLEKYGLSNCIILRSDGTGLYATSDLGLTPYKFEKYKLDKSIWVVASEQDLYFKQLFKILELLEYPWVKNCYHFSYDLVHLPEGKMSSREGKAVMIDEVLEKLSNNILKEVNKKNPKLSKKEKKNIAEKIAIGAFKYNILRVEPHKTITFDWNRMLSFEGDTGPYLQYAHVRADKILQKAGKWKESYTVKELKKEEINLIKKLMQFSNVVEQAGKDIRPHYICNYAHELSDSFSDFYHSCPAIKAETEELRNFRLTLVKAVKITLKNSLTLLGIETPRIM